MVYSLSKEISQSVNFAVHSVYAAEQTNKIDIFFFNVNTILNLKSFYVSN